MERKLELKDIAGYLPYGLEVLHDNCIKRLFAIGFQVKNPIVSLFWDDRVRARNDNFDFDTCKPILRPLSYLYKTITHNGKEIIPIVELAKIHDSMYNWEYNFNNAVTDDKLYRFGFQNGSFFAFDDDYEIIVNNQYQLFDYLHELKIDYRGLIDAGLAISVYDLPENPYK